MGIDGSFFIGNGYGVGSAIPFLSSHNLDETNLIFWTPAALESELSQHGPAITKEVYAKLQRRMATLANWVERGNSLVVIGGKTITYRIRLNSASAQNGELNQLEPLGNVLFTAATGSRVDYCGPPTTQDVFRKRLPQLKYECLLAGDELVPLLSVAAAAKGSAQVVGAYRRLGLGFIFFIPPVAGTVADNKEFCEALATLPQLLRSVPAVLPGWVDAYQSIQEKHVSERISNLEHDASQLMGQIANERLALNSHRELKQLIGGTGAAFASAVGSGLRELGLEVVDGPHPRADLLSAYGHRFIAVEAKGVEGAVKETQFRQIERWIAEVNSAVGTPPEEVDTDPDLRRYATQLKKLNLAFDSVTNDCKGLLIVGTYRTTPFHDRSQPDFPDAVLRLLTRSGVCALTGLQLFALLMQARQTPTLKAEMVDELLSTNGVLTRGSNWSEYLEKIH